MRYKPDGISFHIAQERDPCVQELIGLDEGAETSWRSGVVAMGNRRDPMT